MGTAIDITPLINVAIKIFAAVLVSVITYKVNPWIEAKAGKARADNLRQWAVIGVQSAEQMAKAHPEWKGADKYAHVERFLAEHGFTLNTTEVQEAIEAAVFEMAQAALTEPKN